MIGDYMESKEKRKKKVRIKLTIKNIIYSAFILILLVYALIFYNLYFSKEVYAKEEQKEELKISEAKEIDLDSIITENTNNGVKEQYEVTEETLEYITKYITNNQIPKGTVQVVQEGRNGKQEITTKKTYKNQEQISEERISEKVTKASINKIVEIGGGAQTSSYTAKNGDTVYVTSDRLSVMAEPSENSQKVATLVKNDKLVINEINGEWYGIVSGTTRGYVKKECTTSIDPFKKEENNVKNENTKTTEKKTEEKSSENLKNTLSFNMSLNKPSGLSLEQFKKVLNDDKDKNNIFKDNAEYFYYIEKQYNINGVFVASVGIHESAWGTSKIALQKKNLFGYGAYDSNPYNGAYSFTEYSESIDLIARVFVKYYLNSKGTSIYDGEKAEGTYYSSPTLTSINQRYATDKNWANGVYKYMQYLYNKL